MQQAAKQAVGSGCEETVRSFSLVSPWPITAEQALGYQAKHGFNGCLLGFSTEETSEGFYLASWSAEK